MNDPTIDESLTLESVEQQFEAWRANRTKREPIPDPLWEAAAGLCRRYPITHVCRRLRLSFAKLKRCVSPSKPAPLQFMEFDLSACNAQAGLSCLSGPWHFECERPDGARLRLTGGGRPPSIETLLGRFLS